jgi:hypothetical protein
MRSNVRSQELLIASLKRWEASGNVEPGVSRAANSAVRQLKRAKTRNQLDKALNKLSSVFLRSLDDKNDEK